MWQDGAMRCTRRGDGDCGKDQRLSSSSSSRPFFLVTLAFCPVALCCVFLDFLVLDVRLCVCSCRYVAITCGCVRVGGSSPNLSRQKEKKKNNNRDETNTSIAFFRLPTHTDAAILHCSSYQERCGKKKSIYR